MKGKPCIYIVSIFHSHSARLPQEMAWGGCLMSHDTRCEISALCWRFDPRTPCTCKWIHPVIFPEDVWTPLWVLILFCFWPSGSIAYMSYEASRRLLSGVEFWPDILSFLDKCQFIYSCSYVTDVSKQWNTNPFIFLRKPWPSITFFGEIFP